MMHVAVQPVRTHQGPGKGVELLAAESVNPAVTRTAASIYIIQPVEKLPTINVTRTLAGVLVGRRRAQSADRWITDFASRNCRLWYTMGVLFTFVVASVTLVEESTITYAISIVGVMLIAPVLIVHAAALCWDMLVLLAQTFEFWFLIVYNVVNNSLWNIMFADIRIVTSVIGGASCLLTIFLDANLHMRVLVLRLFVPGAVALVFTAAMANVHLAHGLVYSSLYAWGTEFKTVDIIANATFTIGFFMITRVFRYRDIVFSCRRDASVVDATNAMIQCDIYFPVCRLVPYGEWKTQRRTTVLQSSRMARRYAEKTQLELVERDQLRIIDARDTLLSFRCCQFRSPRTTVAMYFRVLQWILNAIGIAGVSLVLFLSGQEVIDAEKTAVQHVQHATNWHVAAFVATAVFSLVHAACFQRELFRRICFEIDAWFVSFLTSLVALGACDVFRWDQRSLLVVTAWIWCHWMLFLDALPPVMRSRLVLTRSFIVFVNVMLLAFPLWLLYMIFFAPNTAANRNRDIFKVRVGHVDVHVEMLSFLLSRIFTLWVWMGRFFWRELLRPRNSFKLIKYRVQFRLG